MTNPTNTIALAAQTIAFARTAGVSADLYLTEMTGPDLVRIHNLAKENMGAKGTKRFADRNTAVKRTWAALEAMEAYFAEEEQMAEAETTEAPAPAPEAAPEPKPEAPKAEKPKREPKPKADKAERKKRGSRFVFKPAKEITPAKAGSLRAQCVELMLNKAVKFEAVVALVEAFDKERNKKTVNAERRAYELVRIMHYHLGYGIKHDQEKDLITLYK